MTALIKHRITGCLLTLGLIFQAPLGWTQEPVDWGRTFSAETLDSYLEGEDLKVGVMTLGMLPAAAQGAERTLMEALKTLPRVWTVDPIVPPDQSILAREDVAFIRALNTDALDVICILRFRMSDTQTIASAVFYDRAGVARGGFTVTGGHALSQRPPSERPASISEKTHRETARVLYNLRRIQYIEGTGEDDSAEFYGEDGTELLEGTAFYRAVNSPELAQQYLAREQHKRQAFIWGSVLGVGGLAALTTGIIYWGVQQPEMGTESMTRFHVLMTIGSVTTAVGGAVMLVGEFLSPHPVGLDRRLELMDKENAVRAQKLGVDPSSSKGTPTLDLNLGVGPGGIVLSGRF